MNEKLITTIWILSSNDKTPQMTYKGILLRVSDSSEKEIKKIVKAFPELFQEEIPKSNLRLWKEQMFNGENRPKWIANGTKEDIENLEINDIFRNRFRNSINAVSLDADLIKWGLDYIDNYFIKKEKKLNKWWNRFGNIIIPLISIILAGYAMNQTSKSQDNQVIIERIKLNREIIIPTYKTFLKSLNSSVRDLSNKTVKMDDLHNCRLAISELSPYFEKDEDSLIIRDLTLYLDLIEKTVNSDTISEIKRDSLTTIYLSLEKRVRNAVNVNILSKNN